MAKKEVVSIREYARRRGVTHEAVRKAIRDGRIRKTRTGKIDVVEANRAWQNSTDPSKQRKSASTATPPTEAAQQFAVARAMRESFAAQLAKLNYQQRAAILVDANQVRIKAFENARLVRDALLNIPNRISADLAAEPDPLKVGNILTTEITRVLAELAGLRGDPPSQAPGPGSGGPATGVGQRDPDDIDDDELEADE